VRQPAARTAPTPQERPFPIVPWAVTGGLAVGTLVTGIVAGVTYSSFTAKRESFPVTRDDLDSAQSTARTWFIVTGVVATLTVASAAVATYFTFFAPGRSQKVRVGLAPAAIVGGWAFP
jgi:hypothetical protein